MLLRVVGYSEYLHFRAFATVGFCMLGISSVARFESIMGSHGCFGGLRKARQIPRGVLGMRWRSLQNLVLVSWPGSGGRNQKQFVELDSWLSAVWRIFLRDDSVRGVVLARNLAYLFI